METVLFVLDYANINRSATDRGVSINYGALLNYVTAGRFLTEAFCYVPIDPKNPTARDRDVEQLQLDGYLVFTKVGRADRDSYKCDFDVEISIDLVRAAIEIRPSTVILGSGDIDFVPLVEFLRKRGIRVEGAGYPESAARGLILKCSSFINLDRWNEEEVARQEIPRADESRERENIQ